MDWSMIFRKHIPIITVVSLVLLAAVVAISIFLFTNLSRHDSYSQHDFIDASTYQAIFLANNQIYFGHLKNISSDYLILSDVYYIKINEDGAGQLVKLGIIEPHGPQNKMIINQDQVLYWENLKPNSQVIETIKKL